MTTTVSTGRRAALVALVVATAIAVAWTFWPRPEGRHPVAQLPPAPQTVVPGTTLHATQCGTPPTGPFRPTHITVKHVAHRAPILALGRDGNNVPMAPAISDLGKTQFAWDDPTKETADARDEAKPPGAMPGSDHGHVLMNAHTWPDGSALGNRLLQHLQVGDKIVLQGKKATQCYRVTKRIVIVASDGSPAYYHQSGPLELALIVCSPPRLGPGNWLHRTIWFASPVAA